MDHFPPVVNPCDPVDVPYLGGDYDGEGFEGYPARQGWDLRKFQKGDCQGRPMADVARFLQTWLYFGMMHAVLGIKISTTDFVRAGDSHRLFITTQKLEKYLHEWRSKVDQEKKPDIDDMLISRNQQALTCLAYSHNFWFSLEEEQRHRFVGREIGLSIHILASALEHALTSICNIPVAVAPWRLGRNAFLTQRMLHNGWCPCVLEQICTHHHLVFQYYASLLKSPSDPKEHDKCRVGDAGCIAKNISDATYTTKHHEAHCECDSITMDLDILHEIIRKNEIPLVHLEYDGPKIALKVVAFQRGMRYTALSHVWSDGLGNPANNALPKCQILHISNLVSQLAQYRTHGSEDFPVDVRVWRGPRPSTTMKSKDVEIEQQPLYFWIDTLCVPPTPEEYRRNAIKHMRVVYSRAAEVLVLDGELMQSPKDSSPEEKLSRITCSTWIRRLWTLQEAALARIIYYQFSGEAVIILDDPPVPKGESPYARWYNNEVQYYAHLFDFNWWKMAQGMTELDRIYFVFTALKSRSTSHIRDEPICLATLLDHDLSELLETSENHRMKKLWTMCHQLPAAVLFLPGKKLTEKNFGWAPASCMDCTHIGIPKGVPATVTPEGLSVILRGFLLSATPSPTTALIACDLEGQRVFVRQNVKLGSPSWEGLDLHECNDLAVILGQIPMQDHHLCPPLVACIGALLKITRTEDETIFAEYVRMVSVISKDSRFDKNPNPPWSDNEIREKSRVVQALYTTTGQKWCIGSLYAKPFFRV